MRLAFLYSAKHHVHLISMGNLDYTCAVLDDGTHHAYTEACEADAIDVQPATEHFGDLIFLGYGVICQDHTVYHLSPDYRTRWNL